MSWVEIFIVFLVCHAVGDYMLQTEWQAQHKTGGLTGTPEMRRALFSHVATYTLAFVPALIWLADDLHAWVLVVTVGIAVPHLIQDDGRLLNLYALRVKKADLNANPMLAVSLDQSFHMLALFVTALLAASAIG